MKKIGRQVEFLGTSEFNQRNGEGAFVKLKNDSILFGFTEFIGNDWDDDFCARIAPRNCNKRCKENLIWAGAFDNLPIEHEQNKEIQSRLV